MSGAEDIPDAAAAADATKEGEDANKPKLFKFPSHQSHMVSLAKMCRDNKEFADCVIQCDPTLAEEEEEGDGSGEGTSGGGAPSASRVRAHRLVLGSASAFLKRVFEEVPSSQSEATIVVPGVGPRVVRALLDFLYTGEMRVARADTADMRRLIETLQINPDLISVDSVGEDSSDEDDSDEEKEEEEEDKEKKAESRKRKLSDAEKNDPEEGEVKKAK